VQVAVTTRRGSLSDLKQKYIESKAEKLLTYFERVTAIQVTIDFEKDRAAVELLVNTEHKHNFVASDVGEDILATFDQVMRKMEQQIRKYKEKLQTRRRVRASISEPADSEESGESEAEAQPEPEASESDVV